MSSTKQMQEKAAKIKAEQRRKAINAAKNDPSIRQQLANNVVNTFKLLTTIFIDRGHKLTHEGVFSDEDAHFYKQVAVDLAQKGVPYSMLQDAMEQHDEFIKNKYGIDLSKYIGDLSMLMDGGYDRYAAEKAKLGEYDQVMVALFDAVNGFLVMNNMV